MRALALLALIAATSSPHLVAAGRLGGWRIGDTATFADAVHALGEPSSCRVPLEGWSRVVWSRAGVSLELTAYGGRTPGTTPCTDRRGMKVHTVRVTGRQWSTRGGLRVGDPVARLRAVFPQGRRHEALPDWYGSGYWLATGRSACIADSCPSDVVIVPLLVAEVRDGRIAAFVLVVGAEGE